MNRNGSQSVEENSIHVQALRPETEREIVFLCYFQILLGSKDEWTEVMIGRLLVETLVTNVECAGDVLIFTVSCKEFFQDLSEEYSTSPVT